MTQLRIKLLAFQGAPDTIFNDGIQRIEKLIKPQNYTLVDSDPDLHFFLTGGSEQAAIQNLSNDKFYLLIGSKHDNAYASASEVKAYMNSKNISSVILDEEDVETATLVQNFHKVSQALQHLKGKQLGLIGDVSNWLIASAMPAEVIDAKFGIKLHQIAWSELSHFSDYPPTKEFLETFAEVKNFDLTDTARVNEQLAQAIKKHKLDAITVECFPLVKKDCVTACLPLAKFNNDGIPAGCEGDLTAIVGMMLCKELTGVIPWIANVNKVTNKICQFSHCTIGLDMVTDYTVETHFETGEGTAIQGDFKGDTITIFRFDNEFKKAFIATTNIIGRPKSESACRTQIEVTLTENEVKLLKNKPLGNHHLIYPGDCNAILQSACSLMGIEVLQ
ncbi:MAG: hypothetical protein RBR35_18550 [Salinivirgaceae bacterium]|nr:hypothetical protein [Salinivirgaceae bacterium]